MISQYSERLSLPEKVTQSVERETAAIDCISLDNDIQKEEMLFEKSELLSFDSQHSQRYIECNPAGTNAVGEVLLEAGPGAPAAIPWNNKPTGILQV